MWLYALSSRCLLAQSWAQVWLLLAEQEPPYYGTQGKLFLATGLDLVEMSVTCLRGDPEHASVSDISCLRWLHHNFIKTQEGDVFFKSRKISARDSGVPGPIFA